MSLPLGSVVAAFALSGCAGGGVLNSAPAGVALGQQERVAQNPGAMMRIAQAAEQSGDLATALAFYQHAADLQPESAEASIGAARAMVAQGHVEDAINDLKLAHARIPSDVDLSLALGRLLVATGRPLPALEAIGDGLRQSRSPPLLIAQGIALDQVGKHKAAQASYQEALKIAPENAAAKTDLALSLGEGSGAAIASDAPVPDSDAHADPTPVSSPRSELPSAPHARL